MNTEKFLEFITTCPTSTVCISKTSIAAIEVKGIGCLVTLKERRPDGTQIVFDVNLSYAHLKNEINKWERITP